ncbi:unnamed protein product [Echinostoma caproni]|uniref:Transcriptional regulator n=1 Tax=Echinostoma caproni TaxID=27848 RepID=A0A183AK67_9TREM|nr:unnamed protein product [Echinostoma caproni]
MDQSVLCYFKCSFQKDLLEYVLSSVEDEQRSIKTEVDILTASDLVKKTRMSLHPHVLINAFIKSGFKAT